MKSRQPLIFAGIIAAAVLLVACFLGFQFIRNALIAASDSPPRPDNAVDVLFIYAPEEELYITEAITNFNKLSAQNKNPLTGQALPQGEKPIWIVGRSGSSGTVTQGIINAVIAPNNTNVERPVIFSPSVRHWLALVNYQTGQQIFDVDGAPATAIAPVVMAIWQSRLDAIKQKHGGDIGWQELFEVFKAPGGWNDYGIAGRPSVYYGHTDPFVSSTALSTLMAEFYASSRYNAGNTSAAKLTVDQVNDAKVQQGVRDIEKLIKHYSARTTEFKEYIAQGPGYLDFVALEENDLIYINQGKTQYKPPEKLVALYPKEGTFVHDHPFAIPQNVPWVTEEQRKGAEQFTQWVLRKEVQQKVLEAGFRPATSAVPLACPICPENGVDPSQPQTLLPVPEPAVLSRVQQSWQLVKKQADVVILIDTSGSMNDDDKIGRAKEAALTFLEDQGSNNNIGLVQFNSRPNVLVPLDSLETNRAQLQASIQSLNARGNTALYNGLIAAITELQQRQSQLKEGDSRIQAIVLLSDGKETIAPEKLNEVVTMISQARNSRTPILVIPVAYGSDADINALNAIARAGDTKVQSGDAKNIKKLLETISQYF
jgi:Ca-activated chloride channel family protein